MNSRNFLSSENISTAEPRLSSMRKLLQFLLKRPLTWMANNLSASPEKEAVFNSLTKLFRSGEKRNSKRMITHPFNTANDHFIIFSDQHKGSRDHADDFTACEPNYIAALQFYHAQCYHFISLGDCEELWKYRPEKAIPRNKAAFEAESAFQNDKKYFRTFGNHDIIWKNKWDVHRLLKHDFSLPLPVPEGILLQCETGDRKLGIFLTHGHQGDKMSDNNGLSTWLVAHCWAPLQRYLQINVNTPSKDDTLRNKHNKLMYEWSCTRKNLILITGHTHQPVFASGKFSSHSSNHIERDEHDKLRPSYFNTGCCCFSDGDITGIEIAEGWIRLIKWQMERSGSNRKVLEEIRLDQLVRDLD